MRGFDIFLSTSSQLFGGHVQRLSESWDCEVLRETRLRGGSANLLADVLKSRRNFVFVRARENVTGSSSLKRIAY